MDEAKKKVIDIIENSLEEKKNDQRLLLIDIRNLSKQLLETDYESPDFYLYMRSLMMKVKQLQTVRREKSVYATLTSLISFLKEDLE